MLKSPMETQYQMESWWRKKARERETGGEREREILTLHVVAELLTKHIRAYQAWCGDGVDVWLKLTPTPAAQVAGR